MVFCGHNVMYHHTIMCFTCIMLNWILVDVHAKQNAGTLNLSSCMNFVKISNQNRQCISCKHYLTCDYAQLFAKFDAIFEQMPGELMVHKSS